MYGRWLRGRLVVLGGLAAFLLGCSVAPAAPTPAGPGGTTASSPPSSAAAPASPPVAAAPTATVAPRPTAPPSPTPTPAPRPARQDLAFVRDGNLFLTRLDGTGLLQLTREGLDRNPQWSPDGTRLAFIRGRGATAELYVVHADGSSLQRLTNDRLEQSHPRWAPRGGLIAYVQTPDANGNGRADASEDSEVWVVGETGQGARKLAAGFDPAWSPDGLRVAYASNGKRETEPPTGPRENAIHLVNAQGQNDWALLPVRAIPQDLEKSHNFPFGPGTFRVRAPSWAADRQHLAVSADGHTGLALSVDDKGADLKLLVLNYEGGIGRTHWAPKGSRLAVESAPASGYAKLIVIDTASGRRVEIGSERLNVSALEPTWAPNGQRLAAISFSGASDAPSGPRELLIFGADGAVLLRVASGNLSQPTWNPAASG